MRVAFDTSPILRPHPWSVVRTVRSVLAALEQRGLIEVVRIAPPAHARLATWRQSGLVATSRRAGAIGIHSFVSAFPMRGPLRRVQTVHELPWKHGASENAGLGHRMWARLGGHFADAVMTSSPYVARDLGRSLASEGGRVHVVPWGVGSEFQPEPDADDAALRARHQLPEEPFALVLGATRPKKNLGALLAGVARMPEPLQVVVTGERTPTLDLDLARTAGTKLAGRVRALGHVPDADLPGLVRLASVVPVLSTSEGFALPVLEALASGTPVVTTAGSGQATTAEGHSIEVDPRDPEEVAHALARALATPAPERDAARRHARTFTWERTAEGIEKLWESIA